MLKKRNSRKQVKLLVCLTRLKGYCWKVPFWERRNPSSTHRRLNGVGVERTRPCTSTWTYAGVEGWHCPALSGQKEAGTWSLPTGSLLSKALLPAGRRTKSIPTKPNFIPLPLSKDPTSFTAPFKIPTSVTAPPCMGPFTEIGMAFSGSVQYHSPNPTLPGSLCHAPTGGCFPLSREHVSYSPTGLWAPIRQERPYTLLQYPSQ